MSSCAKKSLNLGGLILALCDFKISFHFSVYQVGADRTESHKTTHTKCLAIGKGSACTRARTPHAHAHWCVRICLCACLCGVVHLSREQGDTHRSAGKHQCPRDAFVPPPLVSRAPTDLQGWVRRPWSPKLFCARISPCLCPPMPLGQRHSFERRRNSAESGQLKDPRIPTLDSGLRKKPKKEGRLATKSHFERNVRGLNVDKATSAADGKHMRRPPRAKTDPQ